METSSKQLYLELADDQWPMQYTTHHRQIVRAVVVDEQGYFYFVRVVRNDIFGNGTFIETSGGGVEEGEDLPTALKRELREELGLEVDVLCKIGVVSDYYNLIHRHNINNYYLCKAVLFGQKHLTQDEAECFHLSTLKLTFSQAVSQYETYSATKLGRLLANRELPVLHRAKQILETMQ